jgi:hypothetical protein
LYVDSLSNFFSFQFKVIYRFRLPAAPGIGRAAIRFAGSAVAIARAATVSKEAHSRQESSDGSADPLGGCEAGRHYECTDKEEAAPLDRPACKYSVFQKIMLFFRRRYAASY